ncbi:GTP-binding protein [Arthrobacter mobilis]|uniref:GTPase n=1 Tax=Arthrobacter mobilis TaxID=2724944 RepID=A0A7X6HDY8_9MICC|nr:GTP-binding protein [Arthrobacter mobilis]NKX54438.1 GTPase [Arthrobacter mobilis]
MRLTVVSSIDSLTRGQVCRAVAADRSGAVVVLHDLQGNGVVIRRIYRDGSLAERTETPLEHGCLACTVRLDVVPTVRALLADGAGNVIVGLPPAVPSSAAVNALRKGIGSTLSVESVVLACDPGSVEDQIWDRHTLFESGFTAKPEDNRTPGEFLIGEFAFADTVLLADPELVPVDQDRQARGGQLVRELAPHAAVCGTDGYRPAGHDPAEAAARAVPGSVRIPAAESDSAFTTVVHRLERPLHPERFRHALPKLAEGCCWVRGRLWIASAPRCRIAVSGVGPRVWLENTGPWLADRDSGPAAGNPHSVDAALDWHPVFGDRGTVVAITGEDVDGAGTAALLAGCEVTDAEMATDPEAMSGPFEPSSTH